MTMKSYDTFEDWMKDQSARNRVVIKALRAFITRIAPELEEKVKWGNGCFIGKNNGVIYLYADQDWVQFGFFNGVNLSDPKKKLEGKSQYIRHIKIRSAADIDTVYFSKLLKQAVEEEAKSPNLPTKNKPIFEGLSRPALGALAEAKITTLKKLAQKTERDLLALHGFGPASLPVIRKILKAKGLALKAEAAPPAKVSQTKSSLKKVVKKTARSKAK